MNNLSSLKYFQQEREAKLREPNGWLSVIGLYWLSPGDNSVGSKNDCTIQISSLVSFKFTFDLRADQSVYVSNESDGATLNGQAFYKEQMHCDESASPSLLCIDSVSIELLRRNDLFAIRVKDKNNPKISTFPKINWYPENPSMKIPAVFIQYEKPQLIPVNLALGGKYHLKSPGYITFEFNKINHRLETIRQGQSNQLFLIFKDKTNGHSTYSGGRFLFIPFEFTKHRTSHLVIYFNRAISPPCAVTEAATCPLAPRENYLPIEIPAGEKNPPTHQLSINTAIEN